MKKTALFLCSISMILGLPLIAQKEQQQQVTMTEKQLTPAEWDKQNFASLTGEHKKIVIGILEAVQESFKNTYDAVDKGVDTFMKSYQEIMQCYNQIVSSFMPHPEICSSMAPLVKTIETMLPVMKALEILPAADSVWEPVTRFLSAKGNMTEQDPKRAMNKVFRNKDVKTEMKMILKKQCADINEYVAYINTEYAQEVADFAVLKAQVQVQMQELLSKMQEQQG